MASILEDEIRVVAMKEAVLADNQREADALRAYLAGQGVYMLNVMGSPGSGKTTLLLELLGKLPDDMSMGVIEGDIASTVDARKIAAADVDTVQLRTGGACHIDTEMISPAIEEIGTNHDLLVIENVGNLVCPAEFDTGSHANLMLLSVPEGGDKVLKYPLMFTISDALVVTKCDLLPMFDDFDMAALREHATLLNPDLEVFEVSSKTGEGVDDVASWLLVKMGR